MPNPTAMSILDAGVVDVTVTREIVRLVYEGFQRNHDMSPEDARAETYAQLGEPNTAVIDQYFAEIDEQVEAQTKFRKGSISQKKDFREAGWYARNPDGPLWKALHDRMLNSGLKDAVSTIDDESDFIVGSLAAPKQKGDRRKGLVIGNVQSGKTANYASVIAKAVDAGYKLVIVLAGLHNNLRDQTQQRLDRDLGNTRDANSTWFSLTKPGEDIGTDHQDNANRIVASKGGATLGVVKKNVSRLTNLRDFLAVIGNGLEKLPILIIDDESDQATPDASGKGDSDPTRINQLVREIWELVSNGTYVGYTATPFANMFMPSDDPENDGYGEDMYPNDFIFAMDTPENYFVAAKLFGIDPEYDVDEAPVPDVVRSVSEQERALVAPAGNKDKDDFQPERPESLERAIKWFVVATAVRHLRGQAQEHSSMLVHTTHLKAPHFLIKEIIDDFLKPLKQRAVVEDVEEFKEVFIDEINRAQELYTGADEAPTWPQVKKYIPTVLRKLRTVVDNSDTPPDQRLSYIDGPQTVIVVGGGTLSRGLTLEGLFVSYFTRSSRTYDTLLQMGRWFGYRPGYEDLQRIWVSEGLEDDYAHLALVEAEVRQTVQELIARGEEPANVTLAIRQHPGRLEITNPNKMKRAIQVAADFEGHRMQATKIDLYDVDVLDTNLELVKGFLKDLAPHHSSKSSPQQSGELFTDVDLSTVSRFVKSIKTNPNFKDYSASAMDWATKKLSDTKWNVVLVGGAGPHQTLKDTDYPVKTVNRAPLWGPDQQGTSVLNFRTLMSGEDYILDLKLQGRVPESSKSRSVPKMAKLRFSEDYGARKGLLAIYPISRNSGPRASGSERAEMADVLGDIDPSLRMENDESKPIIGIAFIMPYFDPSAGIIWSDRGVFVGVPRTNEFFDDYEEVEEAESEDNN